MKIYLGNWGKLEQGRRASCAIPSPDLCVSPTYLLSLLFNKLRSPKSCSVQVFSSKVSLAYLIGKENITISKNRTIWQLSFLKDQAKVKLLRLELALFYWHYFARLRSSFPGAVLVALCCATNVGVASLVISLAINYRKKHLPNSLFPSDPLPHNIAFACRFVSWL